ncbi:MAG TPA: hypothetical protein VLL97_06905 [Acidobacteriota bacterium]|nr:hypothetical protein [Acidobacteriota bacterium]
MDDVIAFMESMNRRDIVLISIWIILLFAWPKINDAIYYLLRKMGYKPKPRKIESVCRPLRIKRSQSSTVQQPPAYDPELQAQDRMGGNIVVRILLVLFLVDKLIDIARR